MGKRKNLTWKTSDGSILHIQDIGENHLTNIITMLRKNIGRYLENFFNDPTNQINNPEMWDYLTENQQDIDACLSVMFPILVKEAKKLGCFPSIELDRVYYNGI